MIGRTLALASIVVLAGCTSLEPAGRNAGRAPAPPATQSPAPTLAAPAPRVASAPAPAPIAAPLPAPVAAPNVNLPAPPPRPVARGEEDDIVIPGQVERQVPPPRGDPRSTIERVEDIRAWDHCVMEAQAIYDRDPMRPQLDPPEAVCAGALGMSDRDGVPENRRQR